MTATCSFLDPQVVLNSVQCTQFSTGVSGANLIFSSTTPWTVGPPVENEAPWMVNGKQMVGVDKGRL